jgi:hypothetical protein
MAKRPDNNIVETIRAAHKSEPGARRQSLTDIAVGLLYGALIVGASIGAMLLAEGAGITGRWRYLVAGIAAIAAFLVINRATKR